MEIMENLGFKYSIVSYYLIGMSGKEIKMTLLRKRLGYRYELELPDGSIVKIDRLSELSHYLSEHNCSTLGYRDNTLAERYLNLLRAEEFGSEAYFWMEEESSRELR